MRKINVPTPPAHAPWVHSLEQLGITVGYIWIFTDQGARTIESQYKNAQQLQELLGISRATAYRLINRHKKRYWCSDVRDAENPRCYMVFPVKALNSITIYPVGNPNFANGVYQQHNARRPRKRR